jgi:ParB family chromosome partitioning protein
MDEASLDSLAESIRSHGVVQPLIVRALEEDGIFEIVAGERRWRAARSAGLPRVPVRVIEGSDRELREISLVENIQREDLSPLEIASAISELIQQHSLTQEEVAERIGWSRTAVTNKLRLLQLPEEIRNMLSESLLSEGHCRALLSVESPSMMIALARTAEERGMSVRQLEEAVKRSKLQAPEVSAARRASFVIPEPVQTSLKGLGISLRVTGNPNRMRVSLDGLNKKQMEAFMRFLEERGEELFPGK